MELTRDADYIDDRFYDLNDLALEKVNARIPDSGDRFKEKILSCISAAIVTGISYDFKKFGLLESATAKKLPEEQQKIIVDSIIAAHEELLTGEEGDFFSSCFNPAKVQLFFGEYYGLQTNVLTQEVKCRFGEEKYSLSEAAFSALSAQINDDELYGLTMCFLGLSQDRPPLSLAPELHKYNFGEAVTMVGDNPLFSDQDREAFVEISKEFNRFLDGSPHPAVSGASSVGVATARGGSGGSYGFGGGST